MKCWIPVSETFTLLITRNIIQPQCLKKSPSNFQKLKLLSVIIICKQIELSLFTCISLTISFITSLFCHFSKMHGLIFWLQTISCISSIDGSLPTKSWNGREYSLATISPIVHLKNFKFIFSCSTRKYFSVLDTR